MDKETLDNRKAKLAAFIREPKYAPMTESDIAYLWQVPPQERDALHGIIEDLLAHGQIVVTKKGKLMPPEALDMASGVFSGNERGFGFVSADGSGDVFIPADATNGARHKDLVLYRIVANGGANHRAEGEIVKVLSHGITTFVGTFEQVKNFGIVTPDERKLPREIYIPKGETGGAVTGHKVLVRLTKPEQGAVTQILGHANDPGVDVLSIVMEHGIPHAFQEKTMADVQKTHAEVTEADTVHRIDFRDRLIVTIDGDDAKDLDDAVSLERLDNGHVRLGVHIADVSHYVPPRSALDEEALLRGTSVYLVDRVIPMLPHTLSNGICSLLPKQDRLTVSCVMEIDSAGRVVSHEICPSVICTARRLSYDAVNAIITGQSVPADMPPEITDMLLDMAALSAVLRDLRAARGAIEFNLAECKVVLDDAGRPVDIHPYARNAATSLIEEFMLICNETVAEAFFWIDTPFVYRTHEEPDTRKMEMLSEFAARFGHRLKSQVHAKSIQTLLAGVDKTPEEMIISRTALRSMKQARYTSENKGHFGLAAKYYCHFTSPIRRYPDLQIHRIIKAQLAGTLDDAMLSYLRENLPQICAQCSSAERRAEAAERDAETLKKVEFMADKVGMVFDGLISGVTAWGVFVELPNTVEGLVPVSALRGDTYMYDESLMRLVGRHTGQSFALGDALTVRLVRADTAMRRLEFVPEG